MTKQKTLTAACALLQAILAWECFKDSRLAELVEARRRLSILDDLTYPACEGEDADLIDAELERPNDEGGTV